MVTVLKSLKFSMQSAPSHAGQEQVVQALVDILEQARQIGRDHATLGEQKRGVTWTQGKNMLADAWSIVSNFVARIQSWITGQSTQPGEQDIIDQANQLAQDVAGTEIHAEIEGAVLDTYKEQGVRSIVWIAQPGACPACQANAEEGSVPMNVAFSSGDIAPPLHPNCRCSLGLGEEG